MRPLPPAPSALRSRGATSAHANVQQIDDASVLPDSSALRGLPVRHAIILTIESSSSDAELSASHQSQFVGLSLAADRTLNRHVRYSGHPENRLSNSNTELLGNSHLERGLEPTFSNEGPCKIAFAHLTFAG